VTIASRRSCGLFSISAGIYAITSFVPSLTSHKVGLSLACLVVIVLVNLRGVRESGMLFALPTYAFVTSILVLVVVLGGFFLPVRALALLFLLHRSRSLWTS